MPHQAAVLAKPYDPAEISRAFTDIRGQVAGR